MEEIPRQEIPERKQFLRETPWIEMRTTDKVYGEPVPFEIKKRKGFDVAKSLAEVGEPFIEVGGPTKDGFTFHSFDDVNRKVKTVNLFDKNKVLVSNLYPGTPNFPQVDEFYDLGFRKPKPYFEGTVDFIADAQGMPFKNGNVGAVFASELGIIRWTGVQRLIETGFDKQVPESEKIRLKKEFGTRESYSEAVAENRVLREKVIQETWRILRPGGLLIWKGGIQNDVDFAEKVGFTTAQYEKKQPVRRVIGEEIYSRVDAIFVKEIEK